MENNRFNRFGIMLDMSRNAVMKPEMVKKYIDILSITGYNSLMLYTEDTYEIEGEPYFGYNRGKYTIDELKDIDRCALGKGIELIPCIQTLAHLNTIFHWPCYDNVRDCNDILLAGNDETYTALVMTLIIVAVCLGIIGKNMQMNYLIWQKKRILNLFKPIHRWVVHLFLMRNMNNLLQIPKEV